MLKTIWKIRLKIRDHFAAQAACFGDVRDHYQIIFVRWPGL